VIYFSDFGATYTPPGNVVIAVQDFATGTSTGVQIITSSTLTIGIEA